jgi:hypothetical protein
LKNISEELGKIRKENEKITEELREIRKENGEIIEELREIRKLKENSTGSIEEYFLAVSIFRFFIVDFTFNY